MAAGALFGGVAVNLLAQVAFRRRCLRLVEPQRLVAVAACLALVPLATRLPALAALAAVCAALVAGEARGA